MTTPESGQTTPVHPPDAQFMRAHWSHWIAQGFGSGLAPIMPGTSGTLLAWLSFHVFSSRWPQIFTPSHWFMIIVAGFILGIWVCAKTGRDLGVADHGSLVWDEIIAFWLVLLFVTPAPFSTQCAAFIGFRFFDMVKPPPIRYFEQHVSGGLGVMWDDIVAAFYTLLMFAVWRSF